jgi:hypothetical protein
MSGDPVAIRVVHLGTPLSADGVEAVERAVERSLERKVRLFDVAVPTAELTRKDGDLAFVASLSSGLRDTLEVPGVSVCVVRPEKPATGRQAAAADAALELALNPALASHPRVRTRGGESWSARFVAGDCAPPIAPAPP